MARTTISLHEAKVFHLLKTNKDKWLSHGEIADALKPISDRTVRAHVLRLTRDGIVEVAKLFPHHKHRFVDKVGKTNREYVTRLDQAVALFGLPA